MRLTSHERVMRIFRNEEVDRPALKLWGARLPGEIQHLHSAYEPVGKLAAEVSDLFGDVSFPFDIVTGKKRQQILGCVGGGYKVAHMERSA